MIKILILGFLKIEPMHGYAIQQRLKAGNYTAWTNILPNSIYNALKKMDLAGLVKIKKSETDGKRTRFIYEITRHGTSEYIRLLEESLLVFQRIIPSDLYISLTLIKDLAPGNIIGAIDRRIESNKKEIIIWEAGRIKKTQNPVFSDAMNMIFDNGRAHLEADLKLLNYIRENLMDILSIFK